MIGHAGADETRAVRGFALIAVLWFLVLIAAIGTYMMANARNETAIARNIGLAARAEALADAGVAQAAFNLMDNIASNRWKLDGMEHRLKIADGEAIIRLTDETAKINPNHASDVLLAALFEAAGVEHTRARRLGAAMADWAGADTKPRPFGAKLEQYRQAGLSYGPPSAPVESLDELQLVLGMTPEIFSAVRPYLTIFTEEEQPQTANAAPLVLRALGIAGRQAAGPAGEEDAPDETADETSSGEAGAGDTAPVAPAPVADQTAPQIIVNVEVIARNDGGGIFVRQAVLKIDPSKPKGYDVLNWRRGEVASGLNGSFSD